MNGTTREALRAAIDARRRTLVKGPGCGSPSVTEYRKGCHCHGCRAAMAAYKREWRAANALACVGCGRPVQPRPRHHLPRCIVCCNQAKVTA